MDDAVREFMNTLASQGVKLAADGEQLHCYAPKGALTIDVKAGIARHKPTILSLLRSSKDAQTGRADPVPPRVCAAERDFPLSVGGRTQHLLQMLNPRRSYVVPMCVKVQRDIDLASLKKAWSGVLRRYPILTARIVEEEGVSRHHLDQRCRSAIE